MKVVLENVKSFSDSEQSEVHIIVQGNEEGHTNKHKSLGESNMNKIEDEEIKQLKKGSRKMEIEKWEMK